MASLTDRKFSVDKRFLQIGEPLTPENIWISCDTLHIHSDKIDAVYIPDVENIIYNGVPIPVSTKTREADETIILELGEAPVTEPALP